MPVGYYTSVYGLGDSPDDVIFNGDRGVYCEESDYNFEAGALGTFWRSAENFRNEAMNAPSGIGPGMLWAVSQAAPLRRVHTTGDLILFQYVCCVEAAGYASGGYLANSVVEGAVQSGSQQQWFTRNTQVGGGWPQGVWNMVFVGVDNPPAEHCGNDGGAVPSTVVAETPTVAEKPFITFGDDGLFYLNVPEVKTASSGADWFSGDAGDKKARSLPRPSSPDPFDPDVYRFCLAAAPPPSPTDFLLPPTPTGGI